MGEVGGNVICLDLGSLVRRADGVSVLIVDVRRVIGVWRLKPRARVLQVSVKRICRIELVVDAIEDVLLVAFVVQRLELGAVEEAAGVETADGDEVAPVLAAVCKGGIEAG